MNENLLVGPVGTDYIVIGKDEMKNGIVFANQAIALKSIREWSKLSLCALNKARYRRRKHWSDANQDYSKVIQHLVLSQISSLLPLPIQWAVGSLCFNVSSNGNQTNYHHCHSILQRKPSVFSSSKVNFLHWQGLWIHRCPWNNFWGFDRCERVVHKPCIEKNGELCICELQ